MAFKSGNGNGPIADINSLNKNLNINLKDEIINKTLVQNNN